MNPVAGGIDSLVISAIGRLEREMHRCAPSMASRGEGWMRELAGSERPADYFLQPDRFPVLRLPWWLQASVDGEPDLRFHGRLAYSTVSGYYFIRLVDNVMDGQGSDDRGLLPLLGFFHTEFQSPYQEYFRAQHPFWGVFRSVWHESADAAFHDATLDSVDRQQFVEVAARKVSAAKIPLIAAGYRLDLGDVMTPWLELCDLLGRFEQFMDDMFDWQHDLSSGGATYFLSEANRRKRPAESVAEWVVREGFEWGVQTLESWLDELGAVAERLESREVAAHLNGRKQLLRERCAGIRPVFESLQKLAASFEPSSRPL